MDEQHRGDASDARSRARELFQRTAPALRDVNRRIDQHELLRDRRDAIVDKASELVQKADEALGRITAIEGTIVERTPSPAPEPAPAPQPRPAPQRATEARHPHWTRERFARMASAAATEAVRPHRPLLSPRWRARLGLGALATLGGFLLLRRRRR